MAKFRILPGSVQQHHEQVHFVTDVLNDDGTVLQPQVPFSVTADVFQKAKTAEEIRAAVWKELKNLVKRFEKTKVEVDKVKQAIDGQEITGSLDDEV